MNMKALPNSEFRQRVMLIALFVGLCVVGIGLSFYQEIRLTAAQTIADQAAARDKLQQEEETKYTQGELDSINKVLGQVVLAGNSGTQTVTKALLQGAFTASGGGESQEARNPRAKSRVKLRSTHALKTRPDRNGEK